MQNEFLGTLDEEEGNDRVHIVWKINTIFQAMIDGVTTFRQQNRKWYPGFEQNLPPKDWASARQTRNIIGKQILINSSVFPDATQDQEIILLQQTFELADFRLDAFLRELAWEYVFLMFIYSFRQQYTVLEEEFHRERSGIIKIFMNRNQLHYAYTLAEKYKDFELLIALCEHDNDHKRLESYMSRFHEDNFPTILFQHFCKHGTRN
jgi:nuclear pore complex protein Nup133